MSQAPVPPRYPPPNPYAQSQPAPPLQPAPQPIPAYPTPGQEGYLVNTPGLPQAAQPIPYYNPTPDPGTGIWSYGRTLVMHKQAQLPPICIKCCAPADGPPLKRKLTWHSPWLYLLLLAGLPGILILFIIALCIQKKATIHVGLCSRHRGIRKTNLIIAWAIFAGAIAMFVLAGNTRDRDTQPLLILGGIVLALLSPVYGLLACRMVVPTTIDDQYVWIKGVCRDFVCQFPSMLPRF